VSKQEYDVIVHGAGMVGLVLAAGLADTALRVAVVEPQPQPTWRPETYELRVAALSVASERILRRLNCWEPLRRARVSPFRGIEVRDSESGARLTFDAAEVGEPHLAHIVENKLTQTVLYERIGRAANIDLIIPATIERLDELPDRLRVALDDGRELGTRLLVGADGAGSPVREMAGIGVKHSSYGQVGVVGAITTELPHGEIARQRFLPDGPLALLPLADGRCSIVWSVPDAQREHWLSLAPERFCAALTEASDGMLGRVEAIGERAAFPLRRMHAERYVQHRIALIGDAAHVIHPLAGQGANLGFLDAAALAEAVLQAHERGRDIGGIATLRRFERSRKEDNLLMQRAMDGFHWLFGTRNPLLVGIRGLGLAVTERVSPMKALYMQHAMGLGSHLPALARATAD